MENLAQAGGPAPPRRLAGDAGAEAVAPVTWIPGNASRSSRNTKARGTAPSLGTSSIRGSAGKEPARSSEQANDPGGGTPPVAPRHRAEGNASWGVESDGGASSASTVSAVGSLREDRYQVYIEQEEGDEQG